MIHVEDIGDFLYKRLKEDRPEEETEAIITELKLEQNADDEAWENWKEMMRNARG